MFKFTPSKFRIFKGLDTASNPVSISPDKSIAMLGAENWPYGTISKWLGKEKFHDTTIGAAVIIKSIGQLRLRDGTTKEVVSCDNGNIYYSSAVDTWTSLDSGLGTGAYPHSYTTFLNQYILTDYGQSAPQAWNGAAATTSDVDATCPNGRTCLVFRNRLWMLGTSTNPHLAYFSGQDSKVFTTASDYLTFDTEPGYEITGGCAQRDRILVSKDNSISEIYHTGTSPAFAKRLLTANLGCSAPLSWQALPDGTAMFMNRNGIYRIFGSDIKDVSIPIKNYFEASLPGDSFNTNKFLNAVSGINYQKNQYWISLPKTGSSVNDMLLKYDFVNNEWFIGNDSISAIGHFRINEQDRTYTGDYVGLTYRGDYGGNLNGDPIISYRDSSWTDLGYTGKKKLIRVEVLLESTGTHNITVQLSKDLNETTAITKEVSVGAGTYTDAGIWDLSLWGSATYAAPQAEQTAKIINCEELGIADYFKLRFYNAGVDEFYRIYGYTVWWKPLGNRYVTE